MIYTVTFNPAIDYVMKLDDLKIGEVNRSIGEEIYVGGKGINVSIVLNELGVKSRALGFCAGFTGAAIEKGIKSMGIESDFVHLESGNSRINVKIRAEDETELNGQGPQISREAIISLLERLDMMKEGDTLVLAGSIPNTLPENIYELILERLSGKRIRFVVDATKDLLLNVLKFKPFLIKPNNFELGEMFNTTLKTNDEIISCAKELQSRGAENVLVSMAGDGAILADANGEVHVIGAPDGKVINSVGAGDSMVAGFIAGYMEKGDYAYALHLGTAAGSATAFSMELAKRDEIYRLLRTIQSGKE